MAGYLKLSFNTSINSHYYLSMTHLFIHSFICLFIHTFIYSFIHLFIHAFICLFIYSFVYSLIHMFIQSFVYLFIYLMIGYREKTDPADIRTSFASSFTDAGMGHRTPSLLVQTLFLSRFFNTYLSYTN